MKKKKHKGIDRKTAYLVKCNLQNAIYDLQDAEQFLNYADEDHFETAFSEYKNAVDALNIAVYKMKIAYRLKLHENTEELMDHIRKREPIGETEFIREFKEKYLKKKRQEMES